MHPVIVTPDVEAWAVAWLQSVLDGRSEAYAASVNVSTRVPNPRVDRMVQVRADGGARGDLLYQDARLGVNVWATNEVECADLARLVEGLLLSVRSSGPVELVRSMSGPAPVEDAQPRRFFVVEVVMRGVKS